MSNIVTSYGYAAIMGIIGGLFSYWLSTKIGVFMNLLIWIIILLVFCLWVFYEKS